MANGIHIVAVGGSVRPGNMTGKALAVVLDELGTREGITVDAIDPAALGLPLPGLPATPGQEELRRRLAPATGVVLATPEYHGSYSSVMKLVIDNLGFPNGLAGKPVALVGVAAGVIGAVKALEHLRSVASHVGAIVLPRPCSVARVNDAFDDAGAVTDPGVEKRLRGVATQLLDYIDRAVCPALCLEADVRGDR